MSEIKMSQVMELNDPKLLKIATRIIREVELAAEKVAVNFTQKARYPISADADSFENVLKSRFETLPAAAKQKASAKASASIASASNLRSRRFGDLAGIKLDTATSIDSQVKAIAFPPALKFTPAEIANINNVFAVEAVSASATPVTSKLALRIHRVKCVDETGNWLQERAGDDEIDLGGTSVDETGDTGKISKFRVNSSFDDGEVTTYNPPRQFTFFNLTEGNTFPKSYIVTLVLSEADMGGFPEFINKLFDLVKAKVKKAIEDAGLVFGAVMGAVLARVIGYVVDRICTLIIDIWNDDVFTPLSVSISIPSLSTRWNGRTDSPEQILRFKGHGGEYHLTYDWQLFA